LCHVIISPLIDLEKPDLLDQVENRSLFLGVLWLKSQITNTKLQTNPPAIARHERAGLKFQILNRFRAKRGRLRIVSDCFFVWDFEFWLLLFVCFLGFVI